MMQHKKSIFPNNSNLTTQQLPKTPLKQQKHQQQIEWNKGRSQKFCIITTPSYTFHLCKWCNIRIPFLPPIYPNNVIVSCCFSKQNDSKIQFYPKSTGKSSDSKSTLQPPKKTNFKTNRLKQGRTGSQKGRYFTTPTGQTTNCMKITSIIVKHLSFFRRSFT